MPQFKMKEQAPTEADAVEQLGENIHAAMLFAWTIEHNIRTVERYRPE